MAELDLVVLTEAALESVGMDGLYNSDAGCACVLGDLMPCGKPSPHCIGGYNIKGPYVLVWRDDGDACGHD